MQRCAVNFSQSTVTGSKVWRALVSILGSGILLQALSSKFAVLSNFLTL